MKKNRNGLPINLNLNSGARKSKVIELVNSGNVHSQTDLVKQLARAGIKVTQATASRDLELLGAVRGKSADGVMRYAFVADSTNSVNANLSTPLSQRNLPVSPRPVTQVKISASRHESIKD
ncbi:MAG: hypothetical protein RLZZ378_1012 [Actinomycetota bacterium]